MLELLHSQPLYEVAVVLALAAFVGWAGLLLRQPLIISFLLVGILAGPSGLGIIESYNQIELFASLGIALLLFIVGLKLDLHLIRSIGWVAVATGLGQICFTSLFGFLIALALGMSSLSAAYVAVALTFSSTIIIVKLLSDKREIDSLHGRIAVGFLIVQDIAAIVALVALTSLGGQVADGGSLDAAILMALRGAGFLMVVLVFVRRVAPRVLAYLARSQELLVLAAISWAVLLATISELLGFTKEVGAFVAGISLASTEWRDVIGGRLVTLRDFLLLFFFVDLGSHLEWSTISQQLVPSLVLSLFVLVGNPLIVLTIMGFMGYRKRTGFLAGLTVAQISEFSLILAALGVSLGHIDRATMGLITLVGVSTILLSTYMIIYSHQLYEVLKGLLRVFERRVPVRELVADDGGNSTERVDCLVFGLGGYGSRLVEQLLERGQKVVGVDFDPEQAKLWREEGISVYFGDVTDPEFYDLLPLNRATWVVSTVRVRSISLAVSRILKAHQYKGNLALTARDEKDYQFLMDYGAQAVLWPFRDAADEGANLLFRRVDPLPKLGEWPLSLEEVELDSNSRYAGKRLRSVPIRECGGASVVSVQRGGGTHYAPGGEFRIFPGDNIAVVGRPDDLRKACALLQQIKDGKKVTPGEFALSEVVVPADSDLLGRALGEVEFRQRHDASILAIKRGEHFILTPRSDERLHGEDCLLVLGSDAAIDRMCLQYPELKRARL